MFRNLILHNNEKRKYYHFSKSIIRAHVFESEVWKKK